jgi:hypothetical protein
MLVIDSPSHRVANLHTALGIQNYVRMFIPIVSGLADILGFTDGSGRALGFRYSVYNINLRTLGGRLLGCLSADRSKRRRVLLPKTP